MRETGIIIFARLDSNRLPGKALLPIQGRAMLGRVIDRAKRVKANFPIVVATSSRRVDDDIANFVQNEGIAVYRGDTNDVANRAFQCAREFKFERFVRISGDSPFFDTALISRLVQLHLDGNLDLATNILTRTYPPGSSIEVIATQAMKTLLEATNDADDCEHVTKYFYNNPMDFKIADVRAGPGEFSGVSLVVDTPDDLERAVWLIANAGKDPAGLAMKTYAAMAVNWPGPRMQPGSE